MQVHSTACARLVQTNHRCKHANSQCCACDNVHHGSEPFRICASQLEYTALLEELKSKRHRFTCEEGGELWRAGAEPGELLESSCPAPSTAPAGATDTASLAAAACSSVHSALASPPAAMSDTAKPAQPIAVGLSQGGAAAASAQVAGARQSQAPHSHLPLAASATPVAVQPIPANTALPAAELPPRPPAADGQTMPRAGLCTPGALPIPHAQSAPAHADQAAPTSVPATSHAAGPSVSHAAAPTTALAGIPACSPSRGAAEAGQQPAAAQDLKASSEQVRIVRQPTYYACNTVTGPQYVGDERRGTSERVVECNVLDGA